jgi:hypothetical protein
MCRCVGNSVELIRQPFTCCLVLPSCLAVVGRGSVRMFKAGDCWHHDFQRLEVHHRIHGGTKPTLEVLWSVDFWKPWLHLRYRSCLTSHSCSKAWDRDEAPESIERCTSLLCLALAHECCGEGNCSCRHWHGFGMPRSMHVQSLVRRMCHLRGSCHASRSCAIHCCDRHYCCPWGSL